MSSTCCPGVIINTIKRLTLDDKLLTLPTLLLIKMHSPDTNKKERLKSLNYVSFNTTSF